jgi:nitrogen regulatory protein PII
MKEVKAFIRVSNAEAVIDGPETLGIDGVTLIDVMGLGTLADPRSARYSVRTVERYSDLVKAELVCSDDDVHRIVETLRSAAFTGQPGDGIVYVSSVDMAVKVRTGAVGEAGL